MEIMIMFLAIMKLTSQIFGKKCQIWHQLATLPEAAKSEQLIVLHGDPYTPLPIRHTVDNEKLHTHWQYYK